LLKALLTRGKHHVRDGRCPVASHTVKTERSGPLKIEKGRAFQRIPKARKPVKVVHFSWISKVET